MYLFETFFQYVGPGFILAAAALVVILFIYYVIYERLMNGQKYLSGSKVFAWIVAICYLTTVVNIVYLSRSDGIYAYRTTNLYLFSSYRQAWNNFSDYEWRNLILNIVMFVPMGLLPPLISKRLRRLWKVFCIGFIMTVIIETSQYATMRGIFDIDDIFNNTLGAVIGYGLVMAAMCFWNNLEKYNAKQMLKIIVPYLSPLIVTVIFFNAVSVVYDRQEFGNLRFPLSYIYKQNMKGVTVTKTIELKASSDDVYVYAIPVATKDEVRQFAETVFGRLGIPIEDSLESGLAAIYRTNWPNKSYYLSVFYSGMTYEYYETPAPVSELDETADEAAVRNALAELGIIVPEEAEFNNNGSGNYQFSKMSLNVVRFLNCSYYKDGTIKYIRNNMVDYQPVRACKIISEQEAFEMIKDGKFYFSLYGNEEKFSSIEVNSVSLGYYSDTKMFLQPIYTFEAQINGTPYYIYIPALKS